MLESHNFNVADLSIRRPRRTGAAGDSDPANDQIVLSGARGYIEASTKVVIDPRGREVQLTARLFIEPTDVLGDVIKIRPGDLAQWTNEGNDLVLQRPIVDAKYWWEAQELDHIELLIGG